MNGLAVWTQAYGIGMMVVALMFAACCCLLATTLYVFSARTNRVKRLKKAGKRIVTWSTILLLIVFALKYQSDARTRLGAHRWEESVPTENDGGYTARYAYLGSEEVLLRLYRNADGALLAERTYSEPDIVKLVWTGDELLYDTSASDGKGYIDIPPTLVDRLLAKLP